ncbi:MAG: PTS sugar transporter subunit IIC [Gemmatimonadota bacterium]
MSGSEIAIITILGAIVGLDVVGFPQAMLSRPLVACTLSAAVLGRPGLGLLLGVIMECFALETLPVGASRYPEWGSSSVVAGALISRASPEPGAVLAVSMIANLTLAWLGGWSMVQLRLLNARWARARHDAIARGSPTVVNRLQFLGLGADLARGALLTLVGLAVFAPITEFARGRWTPTLIPLRVVAVVIAGTVAGGAVWKIFHSTAHTRWYFIGGLAAGLVLLLIR